MVPNFFTSEYSYLPEENFLRWFLKWAIESSKNIKPNLHAAAKLFLALVCSRNNFQLDLRINAVADVTYVRLCCTSRKADEITPAPDAAMPWHPRAPCSGARVA